MSESTLFPESDSDEPREIAVPWTQAGAIRTFLHRWSWRADRDVVEQELRELIAECSQGRINGQP